MKTDKQAAQAPARRMKRGSLAAVNAEQSRRRYNAKKGRLLARLNPC